MAAITKEAEKALREHIDGTHNDKYAKTGSIETIDFINDKRLSFCVGNIVKYAVRYNEQGLDRDLLKIAHYALILYGTNGKAGPAGTIYECDRPFLIEGVDSK